MFSAKSSWAFMCLALVIAPLKPCFAADERQSMEELRNTVINLLQALVDQGIITKEKANQMVKSAQDKAAADAAAIAKADEGAVRVPYVPQIVKDEISKQVAETVKPEVVADVVKEAKDEKWGVPAALPAWLADTRLYGSVMLREEAVLYGSGNTPNYYYNYNTVNSAGGIVKAGPAAFLDTSVDQYRFRGAVRLGVESDFGDSIKAGMRLSTGNTSDLVSPTQTLDGTPPYSFGIDNLYIRFDQRDATRFPWLSAIGGRFTSPWFSPTDLIFHKQLNFNGVAITGRYGFEHEGPDQSHLFMTMAAMPIETIALSTGDKWLYAGQLGTIINTTDNQRLEFAVAYYDFLNYEGRENAPNSTLLDYTAPLFFRTGNTVFDIRNDNDPTTNLFAVASKFRLVNVAATYNIAFPRYSLTFNADAVRNIGFNENEIFARTGMEVAPRTKGYQAEVSFGDPSVLTAGTWRALFGYRYLQRDAVIDAFTDSDFHYGGTDAQGYYFIVDYGIVNRVWARLHYMSSNQIDLAPYAVDTIQLDLNTRF
ncbi:MAG TPA: putative porin [Steroidobacteraceae bacterium]|jgi:DNA-binding transcriptional regulator YdaS (Cro superfamily)